MPFLVPGLFLYYGHGSLLFRRKDAPLAEWAGHPRVAPPPSTLRVKASVELLGASKRTPARSALWMPMTSTTNTAVTPPEMKATVAVVHVEKDITRTPSQMPGTS